MCIRDSKISLGQQINEKIEDVDKKLRRFIDEQNQELRENIYGRMEHINEKMCIRDRFITHFCLSTKPIIF